MFHEPMFPSTYVPGTYVPRFAVNDSSTPPRLIFLSLQIDDYSDFCSGGYRVCTLDAGTVFFKVFFREKVRASFHHVDDDDGMTQS